MEIRMMMIVIILNINVAIFSKFPLRYTHEMKKKMAKLNEGKICLEV